MDLRRLKYFVALAEELHFGRAAARLRLAQPALSIQIRNLEDELGGTLLLRTPRQLRLTPAGAALLAEAREILGRTAEAETRVRRLLSGETGRIRIGHSSIAAFSGLLAQSCQRLRRDCPGLVQELQGGDPVSLMRGLQQDRLDIALVPTRFDALPKGLERIELARWRYQLVLPQDHPWQGPVPRAALQEETFVLYAANQAEAVTGFCNLIGFRPRRVVLAENPQMVMALVGAGAGISFLPQLSARIGPELGCRFEDCPEVQVEMDCALVRSTAARDPALERAWAVLGAAGPAAPRTA